jgi:predicted phosphoribosyltransferase
VPQYLAEECRHQRAEIDRRQQVFRGVRPAAPIAGRSVIVTDDGIATGSTMIAALKVTRAQQPHELIVAVPVAAPEHLDEVRHWCDRVVCLRCPRRFWAIGQFYADFRQVEDQEVIDLLRGLAQAAPPEPAPTT